MSHMYDTRENEVKMCCNDLETSQITTTLSFPVYSQAPPHTKVVPNVVYPHFYNYYKSIVSCIKPRDLGTKTPEKSKLRGRFLKWVQG